MVAFARVRKPSLHRKSQFHTNLVSHDRKNRREALIYLCFVRIGGSTRRGEGENGEFGKRCKTRLCGLLRFHTIRVEPGAVSHDAEREELHINEESDMSND